jgi:hypothetical protein
MMRLNPKPRQTHVRLETDGWAYVVRYWQPLDAALCELSGLCKNCTLRGCSWDPCKSICFSRVRPRRLQAECFKFGN